jgi:transcriptional antiterminator RfaH
MNCLAPYWAVAQTEPSREHVARMFLMREGFDTYVPRIKHRKRILPLFPTYVFVRVIEGRFYRIRSTIAVIKILMSGDAPAHLPERVIIDLKKKEHGGFVKLPPPPGHGLKIGQPVRITSGSFAGHIALYQGQNAHERIAVLLDLLGRAVPVELGKGDQVQALPVA